MPAANWRALGVLCGLVAVLAGVEPAEAHDCYARLLGGDLSMSDCAATAWDQLAPILAALALMIFLIVAGIIIATAGAPYALAYGVAMTVGMAIDAYRARGVAGVVDELTPFNDLYALATRGDELSVLEPLGYLASAALKTLGMIPGLIALSRLARGLRGVTRGSRAFEAARAPGRLPDAPDAVPPAPHFAPPPRPTPPARPPRGTAAADPLWKEFQRAERLRGRDDLSRQRRAAAARRARREREMDRIDDQARRLEREGMDAAELARYRNAAQRQRNTRVEREATLAEREELARQQVLRAERQSDGFRAGTRTKPGAPVDSAGTPAQLNPEACGVATGRGMVRDLGFEPGTELAEGLRAIRSGNLRDGMTRSQFVAHLNDHPGVRAHHADLSGISPAQALRRIDATLEADGKVAILINNGTKQDNYHWVRVEGMSPDGQWVSIADPWTGQSRPVLTRDFVQQAEFHSVVVASRR